MKFSVCPQLAAYLHVRPTGHSRGRPRVASIFRIRHHAPERNGKIQHSLTWNWLREEDLVNINLSY